MFRPGQSRTPIARRSLSEYPTDQKRSRGTASAMMSPASIKDCIRDMMKFCQCHVCHLAELSGLVPGWMPFKRPHEALGVDW